jgi:EF hand
MNSRNQSFSKLICRYSALVVVSLGLGMLSAASLPPGVAPYDANKDGVLDLKEAKAAASALFDKLDTNKTGMLDMKQLQGRLSAKEFALADVDKDGTLTKSEYLDAVAKAYKAADVDNDDVLDAGDLKSKPGQAFLRLVQ